MKEHIFIGIAIFLGSLIISAVAVAVFFVAIPEDHFSRSQASSADRSSGRWLKAPGVILKNIVGIILVLVGIVLSIPGVPGQGLLTILLGLALTDIPGKRKAELWVLRRPRVLDSINRLRVYFDKPPLLLDE